MRERICDVANLLELAELTEKLLLERCHPQSSDEFTVDQIVRVVNTIGRLTTIRKTLHQLDAAGQQSADAPALPRPSAASPLETPPVETPESPASAQTPQRPPASAATATSQSNHYPASETRPQSLTPKPASPPAPASKSPERQNQNPAKPPHNFRKVTPTLPAG